VSCCCSSITNTNFDWTKIKPMPAANREVQHDCYFLPDVWQSTQVLWLLYHCYHAAQAPDNTYTTKTYQEFKLLWEGVNRMFNPSCCPSPVHLGIAPKWVGEIPTSSLCSKFLERPPGAFKTKENHSASGAPPWTPLGNMQYSLEPQLVRRGMAAPSSKTSPHLHLTLSTLGHKTDPSL